MNLRSYGPQISLIERKSKSDEKNFSAKYVKDQMKKKKKTKFYIWVYWTPEFLEECKNFFVEVLNV